MPGLFFIGGYPGTARNATYVYEVVGIKTLLPGNAGPAARAWFFMEYGSNAREMARPHSHHP